MELSNEAKLKAGIASQPELTDAELVAWLCDNEPDAIWRWAQGKLLILIRWMRHRKLPDPDQLSFPFHDLSVRIPVKEGFAELRTATIGILRQSERVLSAKREKQCRADSMLGRIRRQIELMEPYSYVSRRITVEKMVELRRSGAPVPTPADRTSMSDAMRRYWAAKTPEERSAIARKRQQKRWKKAKKAAK